MAGQDNRLGAPTEGLGQTVTFAIGGSSNTPQASAGKYSQMSAGLSGGQARNTSGGVILNPVGENEILKTLNRLGQDIVKPKIEAARNAAFVSGMQRVASGEAIKEIVDEQPWYSKIFGDTPAVEGARAFTGFAKSQAIVAGIDANMGNLRELSPQTFKQLMTEKLSGIDTGDADTNVMVAQSLIKEMPTIMKRHTKEHIGWQQDNLAKAQQGAQVAAAGSLMSTLSKFNSSGSVDDIAGGAPIGSTLDAGDVVEKKIAFANTFNPIPGVPLETTQKLSTATIGNLLSQKNLHAYYVLEDAGVIQGLGEDNAKRLRDQADRVESRARAEMPESLSNDFANVRAMVAMYDKKGVKEELGKRISKLNSDYKALTGAREPIISGVTRADMVGDLMTKQINAQRTAEEAWARREQANSVSVGGAATKVQETETAITATIRLMGDGASVSTLPKAQRDAAWSYLIHNDPDKGRVNRIRIAQFMQGPNEDEGQGFMRSAAMAADSSNNPAAWDALYRNNYLPLITKDGEERVALSYFGTEFGRKMSMYHRLGVQVGDVNGQVGAFNLATRSAEAGGNYAKKADAALIRKEVLKYAKNDTPSKGLFSSDALNDADVDSIVSDIVGGVESLRGVPISESVPALINGRKSHGAEFAGGYKWETLGGPRIIDALNRFGTGKDKLPPDRANDVIKTTIAARARALDIATPRPVYQLDSKGKPLLLVSGFDSNHKYVSFPVTIDEMHATWVKGNKFSFAPLELGDGPTKVEQARAAALRAAK